MGLFRHNLQDRDAVVLELLHLLVPAGLLEGRRVAPRVVVESEEVATNGIISAVHVRCHLVTVRFNISRGVSDGDLAETASVDVRLDVTSDSLDVGSTVGGGIVIDDLVGGEEQQCVVVLGELLDGSEDALQVLVVVRGAGVRTIDRVEGSVDIEREVDASSGLYVVSVLFNWRKIVFHTRAFMHSSWLAVLSIVYTRTVLIPRLLNFSMSRLQPVVSAIGSLGSDAPPGW